MTTRILIPVKTVLNNNSETLDLLKPAKCSRCDQVPANHFETHPLKFQAGMNRYNQFSKRFQTSKSFRLRLPLCESCYQANFIEAPETMTRDRNQLATIAKWRSGGIIAASCVTGAAFILLMKVLPLPPSILAIKALWLYLISAALVIYAFTFGLTQVKNNRINTALTKSNYNVKLHRAEVLAKIILETPQPEDVAVIVTLKNDSWANECASHYGWKTELNDSPSEKEEPK